MAISSILSIPIRKVMHKNGASRITLTVNKNNADTISIYTRPGFDNRGPVVQEIGNGFVMDDCKMEKAV